MLSDVKQLASGVCTSLETYKTDFEQLHEELSGLIDKQAPVETFRECMTRCVNKRKAFSETKNIARAMVGQYAPKPKAKKAVGPPPKGKAPAGSGKGASKGT